MLSTWGTDNFPAGAVEMSCDGVEPVRVITGAVEPVRVITGCAVPAFVLMGATGTLPAARLFLAEASDRDELIYTISEHLSKPLVV